MDHSTYADIELKIVWHSEQAEHTERHFFQGINFWRDSFPGLLGDKLANAPDGEWVSENIAAEELLHTYSHSSMATVENKRIQPVGRAKIHITPQRGRFYPRSIIAGSASVTSEETQPLRVIAVEDEKFTVDLNHPLAQRILEISIRVVGKRYTGKEERGGRCNDVVYETLMTGPGIQTPLAEGADFYTQGAHDRIDDADDAILYKNANLEDTFDIISAEQLTELYGRFVQSGYHVLDFMCGAQSYLPTNSAKLNVTGIGLNEEELTANNQLKQFVIHNVNKESTLPFEDNTFDTIIFTAAVEYLVDPLTTFSELKRVTKSGGHIIVTFTDHWNALKSILLWPELHQFERLGLVLDYFIQTEGLSTLHTETIQGLLRPANDKHANKKLYADPIFAVYSTVA